VQIELECLRMANGRCARVERTRPRKKMAADGDRRDRGVEGEDGILHRRSAHRENLLENGRRNPTSWTLVNVPNEGKTKIIITRYFDRENNSEYRLLVKPPFTATM
jgi:hypothetical protein